MVIISIYDFSFRPRSGLCPWTPLGDFCLQSPGFVPLRNKFLAMPLELLTVGLYQIWLFQIQPDLDLDGFRILIWLEPDLGEEPDLGGEPDLGRTCFQITERTPDETNHHHHHHHKTGLTWCRHSSVSGPRYRVSVTHVVSVRRSGKTDTSSTQYEMMRRLLLTWRSLVGRSKSRRRRPKTHGLPVLQDVSTLGDTCQQWCQHW